MILIQNSKRNCQSRLQSSSAEQFISLREDTYNEHIYLTLVFGGVGSFDFVMYIIQCHLHAD